MRTIAVFASVTVVEARTYARGYRRNTDRNGPEPSILNITQDMLDSTPDQLDWNMKGALTPIKDQGDCGSCWAFSTVETIESAIFLSEGKLLTLSEQQLVDCDNYDYPDPRGHDIYCMGGEPRDALTWLEAVGGVPSEEDYPYQGHTGPDPFSHGECKWKKGDVVATVQSHHYAVPRCTDHECKDQDEEALAAAVAEFGPLSISVHADNAWFDYNGGVMKVTCSSDSSSADHAVQLVGYDKTASPPYWLVRNTWGAEWGEKGFVRLPYGSNACGLANEAIAVKASSASQAIWA
jgi:C1A family cysteine protease